MNDKEMEILISADELFTEITETLDHPEFNLTLINILPTKYFKDCHIKDSVNVEAQQITDQIDDWDRTRSLVIYGADDDLVDAKRVYQKIIGMGFADVRILIGGMQEWLDDGYPCQGACAMDYLKT